MASDYRGRSGQNRAHRDDPEFGHRFLADEARMAGHVVCDRTVWRICSAMGWWSVSGKKKTRKKSIPGTPARDDLVRGVFSAEAPNQLWLTDIERQEAPLNSAVRKDTAAWLSQQSG